MYQNAETKKNGSPESPRLPPKFFTAATNAFAENLHLNVYKKKSVLISILQQKKSSSSNDFRFCTTTTNNEVVM